MLRPPSLMQILRAVERIKTDFQKWEHYDMRLRNWNIHKRNHALGVMGYEDAPPEQPPAAPDVPRPADGGRDDAKEDADDATESMMMSDFDRKEGKRSSAADRGKKCSGVFISINGRFVTTDELMPPAGGLVDDDEPRQKQPQIQPQQKARQKQQAPRIIANHRHPEVAPVHPVVQLQPPGPPRQLPPHIATETKYGTTWYFQTQWTLASPRDTMVEAATARGNDLLLQWQTLNPRWVAFMKQQQQQHRGTPPTKEHRKFGSYSSAAQFLEVLQQQVAEGDRTFYEIIPPNRHCRWFADVEWLTLATEYEAMPVEEQNKRLDVFGDYLFEALALFPKIAAAVPELPQDIVISSTSRFKKGADGKKYFKASFHCNSKSIYFENLPRAMKSFNLNLLVGHLMAKDARMSFDKPVRTGHNDETKMKPESILDPAPHSSFQNLKVVLCHKADDDSKTPQSLMTAHDLLDTFVTLPPATEGAVVITEADVDAVLQKLGIKSRIPPAKASKTKKKKKKPKKKQRPPPA
jgi:hypothetical protein